MEQVSERSQGELSELSLLLEGKYEQKACRRFDNQAFAIVRAQLKFTAT
ncbi:hypothetical protein GCM10007107_10320 [Shewanella indica]|nr:hypothetical protein GCM10007107_10320 [Shewanella indica]